VDLVADGVEYQANFANDAIDVLQGVESHDNWLPTVLRGWFGPTAGQAGISQVVELARSGGIYVMAPLPGEIPQGPRLWASYIRAEVPKLFGFEFKGREDQSGVVERDNLTLLFVTLDKEDQPEAHKYDDAFLSATEFRWQSQNRTRRDSEPGRRIAEHSVRGTALQLFVRKVKKIGGVTQPFVYCGPLTFDRWDGDNPITVWFRLSTPVPPELSRTFGI